MNRRNDEYDTRQPITASNSRIRVTYDWSPVGH